MEVGESHWKIRCSFRNCEGTLSKDWATAPPVEKNDGSLKTLVQSSRIALNKTAFTKGRGMPMLERDAKSVKFWTLFLETTSERFAKQLE
jgi:hypothetical protein